MKKIDTSLLEELNGKKKMSREDLEKLLEFTENLEKQMEAEKNNPQKCWLENAINQISDERVEYMERWLEMTEEEKMQEAERKSKQTEEVAKRVGAKVKEETVIYK